MKMSNEVYTSLKIVLMSRIDGSFTVKNAVSMLSALSGEKLKKVEKDFIVLASRSSLH